MGEPHSHAIVVGYAKSDVRRHMKIPPADQRAGRCISCGRDVYVNAYGLSAIVERDADVCCDDCEHRYSADINRSLIES